jgi:hypothetical protein
MASDMTEQEAAAIVRDTENMYLRGELSEDEIAEILETYPDATRYWDKLKLNLKVKRRKLLKRAVDVLKSALRKACGNKRYRAGDQWTTNARDMSRLGKIQRQFFRFGLDVFETFAEFMTAAEAQRR